MPDCYKGVDHLVESSGCKVADVIGTTHDKGWLVGYAKLGEFPLCFVFLGQLGSNTTFLTHILVAVIQVDALEIDQVCHPLALETFSLHLGKALNEIITLSTAVSTPACPEVLTRTTVFFHFVHHPF